MATEGRLDFDEVQRDVGLLEDQGSAPALARPGVPTALRTRVLDPLFTTRPVGCGLGLALVGAIARLHGGRVDIPSHRSELGDALIQIVLPLPLPETA